MLTLTLTFGQHPETVQYALLHGGHPGYCTLYRSVIGR